MDNQSLFGQTYQQIQTQLLGSGSQYFQMLGNPITFNWPDAAPGQISPQAYQIMSAAPPWSPVGSFGGLGTSTLFNNYKMVFSHVGFNTSPQMQQQLSDLSNQATAAQREMAKAQADGNTAYNTAAQNGGAFFAAQYPTMAAWLAGPGSSYVTQQNTAKTKADQIFAQIQALNQANQPTDLQDALNLAKTPSDTPGNHSGPAPRGWTAVPNQAGVLEWQPDFDISTTSTNWRAELTKGSIGEKTIQLDASKSNDSITKSWAGGGASYSAFFWGVYANGSWSETDISRSDSSVTASVKMQSATTVFITPGAWYNGGFLKQVATAGSNGTGYALLSPYSATGGDHALFGQNGLCSTMVNGLVVAYKPSFSITMQSSTYQQFEQQISASAGLRIGPFVFGGEGGHYTQNISTTGNKTTVTGGSTSDDPVIVGVTLAFPGTEKP